MEFIAFLYVISALVALGAGVPQAIHLLRIRNSDEFELGTWVTWTITQSITLLYVYSIGNVYMTTVNIAWVTFYAVMVALIIRFRPKATLRLRLPRAIASITLEQKP